MYPNSCSLVVTNVALAPPPPHHRREPSAEYWLVYIRTTFPIGPHSWDWLRTHLHLITLTLFKTHTHTPFAKSWFAPVITTERFLVDCISVAVGLFIGLCLFAACPDPCLLFGLCLSAACLDHCLPLFMSLPLPLSALVSILIKLQMDPHSADPSLHLSNKTHNILKHLWCFHGFYKIKPEIKGNAGMTSLIGDAMTRDGTLVKTAYFSGFKHSWKHLG